MQTPAVNPNLTQSPTFSCKDILVKKLALAVASSVVSQIIVLLLYIIFANISIYPLEWLSSTLSTFTQLSTWVFVTIFSSMIFAECLICSKDYVLMRSYCSTRFQQFFRVFSVHNFILLLLHAITGGAFVWQILAVVDSSNRNLTTTCRINQSCLVETTFFLIVSGFWIGFYYFVKIYISSKDLTFPVVNQRKFLQFRTATSRLFKDSLTLSILPTVYFVLLYYFWGNRLENGFMSIFALERSSSESSILLYLYSWWFSALYFFTMNLMRFFFHLFLTEPVQFPLIKENMNVLTLQEAISVDNLPIVQHLACLDLFLLSQWSPLRRQVFFTVSQPGGHPHNWNSLVENVLKLFTDYTDLLKKSTESTPVQNKIPQSDGVPLVCPAVKYGNLRNMSFHADCLDIIDISNEPSTISVFENFKVYMNDIVRKAVAFLKMSLGINFLFGELPQVNIQKCLGNGQLIVWATQGISQLATTSLTEDRYGIVQKDLPVIITSLVQLKHHLDKLNKVLALSRKVDFDSKTKNAVTAAVKHSLFNICLHFGKYFNDFALSKDVSQYLQSNVMPKNCN